jgi:hypothetical protein
MSILILEIWKTQQTDELNIQTVGVIHADQTEIRPTAFNVLQ